MVIDGQVIQIIFNVLIAIVFSVFGWFARMIWRMVTDMQKEIKVLSIHIAEDYIKKDEVAVMFGKIERLVGKIFDKLDGKADK